MISAIALLVVVIGIAAYLTYTFDKKDELPTIPPYTKEELDNIKLATELYNKDLRPVVAKKAKAKPAPELEVVEAEFVPKETKPARKKRKYYPKKK